MLQHTGRFWSRIFLEKNTVTTLAHPQFYSDLAAANFYQFPRLKSALKGRLSCDATDIIKNATEELKRFSQNDFQECFNSFTLAEVYS